MHRLFARAQVAQARGPFDTFELIDDGAAPAAANAGFTLESIFPLFDCSLSRSLYSTRWLLFHPLETPHTDSHTSAHRSQARASDLGKVSV